MTNIDDLPELTDKEKAACDALTPDMLERIFRGDDTRETECQRIDALAAHVVATGHPIPLGENVAICRRLVGLLESCKQKQETFGNVARELLERRRAISERDAEITTLRRQLNEAQACREVVKQPVGLRLCGAAVAAMATNQSLEYVVANARGGAECCSRVTWMSEYLARKGVILGTFVSVPDYRTGERLTINGDTTLLRLDLPFRGRPAIIGCDSEAKAGQLHWVYWDGEHVRDPNPDAPDKRPLSDFAGKIVDVFPLTFVVDGDGKLECAVGFDFD